MRFVSILRIVGLMSLICFVTVTARAQQKSTQSSKTLAKNSITFLESDQSGVTFEVKIESYELRSKLTEHGDEWQEIIASNFFQSSEPGKPALPMSGELIGIPLQGEPTISILNVESKIEDNVWIYPAEKPIYDPKQGVSTEFTIDSEFYQQNAFYPIAPVRLEMGGFIRDQRVAKVVMMPFSFNPNTRQLRVLTYLKFKIQFASNQPTTEIMRPQSPELQNFLKGSLSNYAIAKNWRKPFEPDRIPAGASYLRQGETVYKLYVDADGIYQLDYDYFIENEINISNVDPRTFRLYNNGVEIPIYVFGESDRLFNETDYIEFYGERNRGTYHGTYYEVDPFSDRNVYWLTWGGEHGLRMGEEDGSVVTNEGIYIPDSYTYKHYFEKNNSYDRLKTSPYYLYEEQTPRTEDRWFWGSKIVESSIAQIDLDLLSPDITKLDTTRLKISFYGGGAETYRTRHQINIFVNQRLAGQGISWYGREPFLFDSESVFNYVLNTHLLEDGNQLTISTDFVDDRIVDDLWLNWIELEYARMYVPVDDYIEFTIPRGRPTGLYQFPLEGFSDDRIDVYKLGSSRIVKGRVEENADRTGFNLTFQDEVVDPNTRYVALTEAAKKQPILIVPDTLSTFHNPNNGAQFVIITANHFKDIADQLADYRQSRGIQTVVATIEDIYDDFNDGVSNPYTIRDFLEYAYYHWQTPPEYVLLLGSGSQQNYKSEDDYEYKTVPAYAYRSADFGYVASDNWYASVTSQGGVYDYLPDFFIGRIPVKSREDAQTVIDKVMDYERYPDLGDWRRKSFFIAGNNQIFINYSELLIEQQPEGVSSSKLYVSLPSSDPNYGRISRLLDVFDEGVRYAMFQGHGGAGTWSDNGLLSFGDIPRMRNLDRLPIIISLTCFSGVYDSPGFEPVCIRFITHERGGAVGTVGSSAFGYTNGNYGLGSGLLDALFRLDASRFGQWVTLAKLFYYKQYHGSRLTAPQQVKDSIHEYHIFGDPTLEFNFPSQSIATNVAINSVTEDSISLNIQAAIDETGPQSGLAFFRITRDADTDPAAEFADVFYESNVFGFSNGTIPTQQISIGNIGGNLTNAHLSIYAWDPDAETEAIGGRLFNISTPDFDNIQVIPSEPTTEDSVLIQIDLKDELDTGDTLYCYWRYNRNCTQNYSGYYSRTPMRHVAEKTYVTTEPILPSTYSYCGRDVRIYYCVDFYMANMDSSVITPEHRYTTNCPPDFEIISGTFQVGGTTQPVVEFGIHNHGGLGAENIPVRMFYKQSTVDIWDTLYVSIPSLEMEEHKTITIPIDSLPYELTMYDFVIDVNPDHLFGEELYTDNSIFHQSYPVELIALSSRTNPQHQWTSIDQMVECSIVSNDSIVFSYQKTELPSTDQQPDLIPIFLANGTNTMYTITPNDSTYTLTTPLKLRFTVGATDTTTIFVYRYFEEYGYWYRVTETIHQFGNIVELETYQFGTYALFRSKDAVPPSIRVDIEAQQFANGGYASEEPIITAIFSDINGVDFLLRPITVYQDGATIPSDQYVFHINPLNPSMATVRYEPKLNTGSYEVMFEGYDTSGNLGRRSITFNVVSNFDILHVGNYPNPVQTTDDETIFTYTLTRPADEVVIKIYTVAGRLIKTIREGDTGVYGLTGTDYHEIAWDCRTDEGKVLANGAYFYQITAKRDDQEVTKTGKLAIVR